jgi:hypothetical protein
MLMPLFSIFYCLVSGFYMLPRLIKPASGGLALAYAAKKAKEAHVNLTVTKGDSSVSVSAQYVAKDDVVSAASSELTASVSREGGHVSSKSFEANSIMEWDLFTPFVDFFTFMVNLC